jgi:hypothetical protein
MLFKLREQLLAIEQRHGNKELTPSHITRLVRQAAGDKRLQIRTCRTLVTEPEQIIVGGAFDSSAEPDEPWIEITLLYHPYTTSLNLSKIDWDRVSFDIAECVGHELVHSKQRKRHDRAYKTATTEDQEYLGNLIEIDAYGYSIAAELAVYHAFDFEARQQVFMYRQYCDVFSQDQSVIIELEQHILKYLYNIEAEQDVKTIKQHASSRRRSRRNSRP